MLAHALGFLKNDVVLGDMGDVGELDGSGLCDLKNSCDRERDMKVALEWDGAGCRYGDLPFMGRGLRLELVSSTSSSISSSLASSILWMSVHSRGRSEPQCEHRRVWLSTGDPELPPARAVSASSVLRRSNSRWTRSSRENPRRRSADHR